MKILLNISALLFTLLLVAQPPVFVIETEIAPCGGKGKMIFTGLVPELQYKISMNNGVSFSTTKPDADGKIVKVGLAGPYDIIMQNEFGRITPKGSIPSEGVAPTFSLSQEPSICGNPGTITVSGLTEGEAYRISTNNGESYQHLSANEEGNITIDVAFGGKYDVLVANNCGFTKHDITVGEEGSKPEFSVEAEPSQCDKLGTLLLNGLEPIVTYQMSTNGGESFEFINTNENGTIKKGLAPGNYDIIVKSSCGTANADAAITSEGSAPTFTTSTEMEGDWAKKGNIVFSGLDALVLYQVSLNGGQSYSFVAADENGEIRRETPVGNYSTIVKNKCGSSSAQVEISKETYTGSN